MTKLKKGGEIEITCLYDIDKGSVGVGELYTITEFNGTDLIIQVEGHNFLLSPDQGKKISVKDTSGWEMP